MPFKPSCFLLAVLLDVQSSPLDNRLAKLHFDSRTMQIHCIQPSILKMLLQLIVQSIKAGFGVASMFRNRSQLHQFPQLFDCECQFDLLLAPSVPRSLFCLGFCLGFWFCDFGSISVLLVVRFRRGHFSLCDETKLLCFLFVCRLTWFEVTRGTIVNQSCRVIFRALDDLIWQQTKIRPDHPVQQSYFSVRH